MHFVALARRRGTIETLRTYGVRFVALLLRATIGATKCTLGPCPPSMRVLTFATVVLGVLACMAGILGMNFDAPFFHTSATGFWIAVGAMMSLAIAALVIGKAKRWM